MNAIEAFNANNVELPVNVKFLFESMEEVGSVEVEETILQLNDTFLKVKTSKNGLVTECLLRMSISPLCRTVIGWAQGRRASLTAFGYNKLG